MRSIIFTLASMFVISCAGSWPGYVFTGDPLRQPAGHFGLCHGSCAHAPDEYYLIEPSDPRLHGIDAAVRGFVDYLYELA
jgi:hypothetical protein